MSLPSPGLNIRHLGRWGGVLRHLFVTGGLLLCCALLSSVSLLAQSKVTVRSGTLTVTNGALTLGGDFANESTFNATQGTVAFLGTTDQQFSPGSGATINALSVAKRDPATKVYLADSVLVTDSVLVLRGDLDLNGKEIALGTTGGLRERVGQTVTGLGGGTITATRFLNAPNVVDVGGLGARITSDKNMSATVVTRGHVPQSGTSSSEGIARYYDIVPAINSGLDATLEFFYDESELAGLDEATLALWRSEDGGATYVQEGGSVVPSADVVATSGIEAFSRWTATSSGAPLPVELAEFTGERTDTEVRLTWQTASETNNAGFHVERRTAVGWSVLGFVDGRGMTDVSQSYRFTDAQLPFAADSLRYRLRQVDLDGTATLTDEVVVRLDKVDALSLHAPFPNPARDGVTLRYAVPSATDVDISLYNVLGQQVATIVQGPTSAGRVEQHFDTRQLPSGMYFVRLGAGGEVETQRLVVVR